MPKKLTYEFVKSEFEKEDYKLLSTEYIDANTKLDFICPNGHHHFISYYKFKLGQRCLYCQKNSPKDLELFKSKLQNYNTKIKIINIEKKLKSNRNRYYITFICSCGEEYIKIINNLSNVIVLQCKKCGCSYEKQGRIAFLLYTEEFVKNYLKQYGYTLLSEYINTKTYITIQCDNPKYNPYKILFNRFKNGYRCKKCHDEYNVGPNHHSWDSSLTEEERLQTRHVSGISKWKKDAARRDEYTCQITGLTKNDGELDIHHLNSFAKYPDQRIDINNGITLNKEIHIAFHRMFGKITTKQDFEDFIELWND